jgi:hypothetical protein
VLEATAANFWGHPKKTLSDPMTVRRFELLRNSVRETLRNPHEQVPTRLRLHGPNADEMQRRATKVVVHATSRVASAQPAPHSAQPEGSGRRDYGRSAFVRTLACVHSGTRRSPLLRYPNPKRGPRSRARTCCQRLPKGSGGRKRKRTSPYDSSRPDGRRSGINAGEPAANRRRGHTQVDFEERVNFRRLHDYRLARTRAALANSGWARCCASTSTTSATPPAP